MSTVLKITNLHQIFEKGTINENHVLKGINLEIESGDFITIIGGNGAGKSTLLNSIAGAIPTETGKIELNGQDITKQSVVKRSRQISRVFQDPKLGTAVRLTVEENMAIALKRGQKRGFSSGVKAKNREFFREQLQSLNLGLENRLTAEIGLLSGGQRQAITLLMATLVRPELILLDEHTAALDPHTSENLLAVTDKQIKENKLTALMITHHMEDALKYGNRLLVLKDGKVKADISEEEKRNLKVSDLYSYFED